MSIYLTIVSLGCLILVSNGQFYPGYMGMRPQFPGFGPMAGAGGPPRPNPTFTASPSSSNPSNGEAARDNSNTVSSVKEVANTLGNSCLAICEKQKQKTYGYVSNSVFDLMEMVRIVVDCPRWCESAKVAFENGIITLEKLGQEL